MHVKDHLDAWDRDYRSRGRLWGSATKGLPDLPEGTAVLELGCGNGKTLSAMKCRGWKVVALDISAEAVKLSSQILPDVSFLLANACRLPFQDDAFDAVFAFHITGHLLHSGRRIIASEAARVLRKDGRLFFREFGADDMRAGRGDEVEPCTFRRGEGMITHYFTKNEAAGLFCDLKTLSVQSHCWKMRINGEDMMRSEIEAVFIKNNA